MLKWRLSQHHQSQQYLGLIPGLEIDRTFFHERFFYFKTDSVNCADSGDTKIFVQFPGNSIWKRCPPTQTPTQMLKSGFLIFRTQEIGSSLVSFQMIFEALQSELFNFHFISSKILKNPGIQPNYDRKPKPDKLSVTAWNFWPVCIITEIKNRSRRTTVKDKQGWNGKFRFISAIMYKHLNSLHFIIIRISTKWRELFQIETILISMIQRE